MYQAAHAVRLLSALQLREAVQPSTCARFKFKHRASRVPIRLAQHPVTGACLQPPPSWHSLFHQDRHPAAGQQYAGVAAGRRMRDR
ncbi:hypothetical protein E2C01_073593 [Portunus trituberculatus]|uniref:Uncharacterized protein n=1 Tax=Portunus trituberculatus TaxID=210409 RepID=A0A5B7I129_PORTR|nr:hypothetical protein [Portunus trituberculatus]